MSPKKFFFNIYPSTETPIIIIFFAYGVMGGAPLTRLASAQQSKNVLYSASKHRASGK